MLGKLKGGNLCILGILTTIIAVFFVEVHLALLMIASLFFSRSLSRIGAVFTYYNQCSTSQIEGG